MHDNEWIEEMSYSQGFGVSDTENSLSSIEKVFVGGGGAQDNC